MAKRKHHYIPQFYLKGFTNESGELHVLKYEENTIEKQGKKGTFHAKDFYKVEFDKFEKRDPAEVEKIKKIYGIENVDTSSVREYPDAIEDLLSESESLASQILPKLLKGDNLSTNERVEMSTFIAFMHTRTPIFRNRFAALEEQLVKFEINEIFKSKADVQKLYDEMKADGYEKEIDVNTLMETVENDRINVEIPRELSVKHMLYATSIIDRILYGKQWVILEAHKNSSFVTSDNPLFTMHPKASKIGGFEIEGAKVLFPLSKEKVLMMTDNKPTKEILHIKLDKKQTRTTNKIIMINSNEYLIARDKALLERLKKFLGSAN